MSHFNDKIYIPQVSIDCVIFGYSKGVLNVLITKVSNQFETYALPGGFIGRRIGIWIPNQYGAYRMYLNGDLLLRLGEVGTTNQTHQTENAPRFAYFIAENEYFTVTMQVSSFQSLHGGLENPMRIGLS